MQSTEIELARCDREIERCQNTHDEEAWLIALAINDWQMERAWILRERSSTDQAWV